MKGEPLSTYLDHLVDVAENDVEALQESEKHYGDSWKKRGGVGAFMMLARKWDRIEKQVQRDGMTFQPNPLISKVADKWDIFEHCAGDPRPEGLIDDIRDLRRYLLLVEAEIMAQGGVG
jgi:hypothetical protein